MAAALVHPLKSVYYCGRTELYVYFSIHFFMQNLFNFFYSQSNTSKTFLNWDAMSKLLHANNRNFLARQFLTASLHENIRLFKGNICVKFPGSSRQSFLPWNYLELLMRESNHMIFHVIFHIKSCDRKLEVKSCINECVISYNLPHIFIWFFI